MRKEVVRKQKRQEKVIGYRYSGNEKTSTWYQLVSFDDRSSIKVFFFFFLLDLVGKIRLKLRNKKKLFNFIFLDPFRSVLGWEISLLMYKWCVLGFFSLT